MLLLRNSAGFSSFHPRKGLGASFRAKPGAGKAAGEEVLDGTAGETNAEILKNVKRILLTQIGFFSRKSELVLSDGRGFLFELGKRISQKCECLPKRPPEPLARGRGDSRVRGRVWSRLETVTAFHP